MLHLFARIVCSLICSLIYLSTFIYIHLSTYLSIYPPTQGSLVGASGTRARDRAMAREGSTRDIRVRDRIRARGRDIKGRGSRVIDG